jgi:ribonuclease HII
MAEQDLVHPGYGFCRHKGYPTAEHFEALGRLGACPIHRRSFQPVREALGLAPLQGDLFAPPPPAGVEADPEPRDGRGEMHGATDEPDRPRTAAGARPV